MKKKRKHYAADFKARVALAALKETQTVAQLCSKLKVDAGQINKWKKELLERSSELFARKKDSDLSAKDQEIDGPYKQIGKLSVQNEFLREKLFP
jgi:transposase